MGKEGAESLLESLPPIPPRLKSLLLGNFHHIFSCSTWKLNGNR